MTREPVDDTDARPDDALRGIPADVSRDALDATFTDIASSIRSADARPLASLRARSTLVRRLIAIASFVGIFCFAVVTSARADLAIYPLGRLVVECAAYGTLLFLSVFSAVRSEAMPTLPRERIVALIVASIGAAVVLAIMPAPHAIPVHLVGADTRALAGSGSPCMHIGLGLGIPIYVVLRLVDRGSPLGAVLAASAAGLLANLVLQVHCSATSVGHRLVGHASIGPVLLACLGAALLFERIVMSRKGR